MEITLGHPVAPKIEHLPAKLLAIRRALGLSQPKMAHLLPSLKGHYHRISEFESGRRRPSVLVLLSYARAAGIPLENLIDDDIEITLK